LVTGVHVTDPTTEGTYSGIIALRTLRLAIFAGELNHLKIRAGDISSAYLEAHASTSLQDPNSVHLQDTSLLCPRHFKVSEPWEPDVMTHLLIPYGDMGFKQF
jgi:hypothetical protein